ncbi:MAG TPA: DHH family phosphoesterase, partial [Patescibacteria group bacterium]|nr:DHH family phosphoesterase [Patescibacteria group bacterium]
MKNFAKEFHTLNYVIKESQNILLFAHSHPDEDTTGSVLALKEYIKSLGKDADIACFDPFPENLKTIIPEKFEFPARLEISKYKLVIACDSVERGFEKIVDKFPAETVIALIDHHPDIKMKRDINIIDASVSSVCELVYEFFRYNQIEISRVMATSLMLGILGDTGTFQHANTTARTMEIASDLMKKGAPVAKIVQATFSNRNISTLKLWGR